MTRPGIEPRSSAPEVYTMSKLAEYFLSKVERSRFDNADLFASILGTVNLIFWGGGGGAWNFFEKKFLALILTKKNNIAQWHSEKNNLSPIV